MKHSSLQDAYTGQFYQSAPSPNTNTLIHSVLTRPVQSWGILGAIVEQEIQFPDVSFYQEEVNYSVMRLQTDTIIIRIGQNLWPDEQFERNYLEAKKQGMKVGGYWFYDDRVDPRKQAELLISLCLGKKFELEIFIDWENSYGGQFKGLKNVVAMMELVDSAIQVDLFQAKEVGMYTGYYFFRGNSNPITNASQYNYLKNKPLWLAWYTDKPANVLIPAPWTTLTLWQFGTPVVNWGQATKEIDMNWFNGTQQEFSDRYGTVVIGEPMNYVTNADAKLWKNSDGTNQISTIKVGTNVAGDSFTSSEYVRLTSPVGYTKKIWLKSVTTPPPPPPSDPTIVKTHQIDIYNNGRISIDGGELI